MNHPTENIADELVIANRLIQFVTDRATGRFADKCDGDLPRNVYFIGNLRPVPLEDETERWLRELAVKLSPVAMGLDALVRLSEADPIDSPVRASWSVYYRVKPNLDEQRAYQNPSQPRQATEEDSPDEQADAGHGARELPKPIFKKLTCRACGGIRIKQTGEGLTVDSSSLQNAINAELTRVSSLADEDPEIFRVNSGSRRQGQEGRPARIDATATQDSESYARYWNSMPEAVQQAWTIRVESEIRPSVMESASLLSLSLVNETPISQRDELREPFLFDVSLTIDLPPTRLCPFHLSSAPKDFRENPEMFGRGRNCCVEREGDSLTTTHTPIYAQGRYEAQTQPSAQLSAMISDPIAVLDRISRAMHDYEREWDVALAEYREQAWWDSDKEGEFESERSGYIEEVRLFDDGLALLRTHEDVAYAFLLTNQSFHENGLPSWRLMQIVFLVSQLPGLTTTEDGSAERETVDIIYFPTGGGKTEAYLSAVIFTCFWDRLRGKAAGVSAWARFPLRLLTAQQLQRFTNIISAADTVRRKQTDSRLVGNNVDGFAVGYYVGTGGTPNQISAPNSNKDGLPWVQAQDITLRQKYKRVATCPCCKSRSITVDFDESRAVLIHRCTNQHCALPGGVLPLYIVDNDVYRYLPSVIVGTIDKLAIIGIAWKFRLILGRVDGKCPRHGYYNMKCNQDGCQEKLTGGGLPPGISGPTLFVQDELHLLREGLGTFDSHYETLLQEMLRLSGSRQPVKLLASSATIEQFRRQVEHLYGRRTARIFPGPGPKKGESFYAKTRDYPQRLFVGVLPHNKTLHRSLIETIEYYMRGIVALEGNHQGVASPDRITLYSSTATYFLANRELDVFNADLLEFVAPRLLQDSLGEPRIYALTGKTSADEVSGTLAALETHSRLGDPQQTVLATNTISHGVDIDRLNCMFFFGMPRQTSEYIQASSRVGRRHVGVVFTFLNPGRERDQSHYHYFAKQHEFLGKLVEPIPVNRWSKFSLDFTLPGAFTAYLLQNFAAGLPRANRNDVYSLDKVKRMISDERLRFDDVASTLYEAYRVINPSGETEESFHNRLTELLRRIMHDQIETNVRSVSWLSDALDPPPMRSLRAVDAQVPIRLDHAGQAWARLRDRRRGGVEGADD